MKLAIAALAVVALAAPLKAQESPNPRVWVKLIDRQGNHVRLNLPVTHRTADRTFLILASVSQAMTIADNEYSLYTLKHDGAYEINPLLGRHPSRGTYYAVNEALFALTTYVSYRAKREHDAAVAFGARPDWTHRIWYMPQVLNSAVHAIGIGVTVAKVGR